MSTRKPNRRAPFVPPYPPSWVDRFTDWLERLPLPWWLFYLVVGLLLETVQIYVLWSGSVFDAFGIHLFQFYFPINYVLALFVMHALDRRAVTALERFRPALRPESGAEGRLLYELTTLSARPTILAGLAGLAFGVAGIMGSGQSLREYPMFGMNTTPAGYAAGHSCRHSDLVTFIYHTITNCAPFDGFSAGDQVDLYRLRPICAGRADRPGRSRICPSTLSWPDRSTPPPELNLASSSPTSPSRRPIVIFLAAGGATAPGRAEGTAGETAMRAKSLAALLHERMTRANSPHHDRHKAITALEFEAARLLKTPTWPWNPGTFRGMLAAVFLPLLLWVVQFGLQRLLVK
jgi:hypothetical protein